MIRYYCDLCGVDMTTPDGFADGIYYQPELYLGRPGKVYLICTPCRGKPSAWEKLKTMERSRIQTKRLQAEGYVVQNMDAPAEPNTEPEEQELEVADE